MTASSFNECCKDRRVAIDELLLMLAHFSSNRKLPRIVRSASHDALDVAFIYNASRFDASLGRIIGNPPLPSGPLRVAKASKEVFVVDCRGLLVWIMIVYLIKLFFKTFRSFGC